MINNIYNTISKTLVKGLVFVALVGVMMSGTLIGGGIKANAYTEGYFFNLCNDKQVNGGAISCTSENKVSFTECQATKGGIDIPAWFCGKSSDASLTKAGGFETKIDNCNQSNSTYVCGEGNLFGETCIRRGSDEIFFCKNTKGKVATVGDSKNVYTQPDGAKVMPLIYNDKNIEISCLIEVVENTSVNGSYSPKKIIACGAGSLTSPESIIEVESRDGQFRARANCQVVASQAVGNISPWNRGGVTLNCFKETITFSDNTKADVWFSDPTFQVLTPEDKIVVIKYQSMDTLCGNKIRDEGNKACKITKEAFFKEVKDKAGKDPNDFVVGEKGTGSTGVAGVGAGNKVGDAAKAVGGGIFSILYKIIGTIIFVLLFIVRYLQMIVLLLFISVMTVLLNLSPNSSLLTSLAVPLWGIFAQIANLGAVAILIYLGSATMIGIMKYDEAIKKGTQVALYTFVASFTYFGLAFMISLLDGFVKLIVYVFGGGSTFKLFEALIGSVSSISKISGAGGSLIPDIGKGFQGAAEVFGKSDTGITTTLIQEIIVVIGLTFILIVFKNVFFMLLTRVAILLLLLITSPLWVLGYLVKDTLPGNLKGQMEKAVELTLNSIVFNFAFVITLVLVTIITQRINEGASKFITENLASALVPQTNSGLALLDPVTASAQVNTAVDSAFGDFGLPFLNTISIIVVLSLNLVIIQQAFKFVETLIDQSIVQAGQAVGKQVSRNLQNFRKAESFGQGIAMLGKDVYSGASKAITGDNQLLMDAGGAGAKSLNFAGKGIVGANRYIRDADGKNAEARREFNANLKSKGLGAWKGVTNPGKTLASLNNTIQDRAGISGRRINQDMIDDYNKKKLKNGGRALTIEEELRQRERLQIAAKFEKEESEKAKAAGDKNLANANASTDPAIRAQVATLNASEKALEASTKALEDINAKITENKANLEAFQTANGYTDNTEIQDIKPEDLRIMNNLRNVKLDLERDKPAAETLVGTNQALYSSNLTAIRGQVNDDLAKTSSAKLASHLQALDKTNSEGIDAAIAQAEKIGKRSFAGNINRYTENAEKVGGDIDDWARGGKANTKFATDQDFQAALIKQLEELKKTQSNNPPPGP